jgi:hypothetical protein
MCGGRSIAQCGLAPRRLRDVVTFYWEMLPANGETVLGRGLEFLIVNGEGRILVDYMFYPS